MYRCKPERSAKQAILLIAVCSVLTLTAFYISVRLNSYRGIAQFTGVALLAISIMLVNRYTITEMEYLVDSDCFTVVKCVGNKRTEVCSLDLSQTVAFVDKKTCKATPEYAGTKYRYVLTQNMKAQSMVYICKFKDGLASVEFEPNVIFITVMREAIDRAAHNDDTDENDNNTLL